MKRLLDALEPYRKLSDSWPKTPRGLGDALRRNRPALKTVGIDVNIGTAGRAGVNVRIVREYRDHCERRLAGNSRESNSDAYKPWMDADSKARFAGDATKAGRLTSSTSSTSDKAIEKNAASFEYQAPFIDPKDLEGQP